MTDPRVCSRLFDPKPVNHWAKFPCCDINLIKDFVGFKIFLFKRCCPENWEEGKFSFIQLGFHFKRNAKCLGTQGGKGALKKKQTTAIKRQMANIWAARGRAAWAAGWIAKVWQILYSVLIWCSPPAFSFFGNASHIWTKMPFPDAPGSWGLSGRRRSVLLSTSLCLCAAGEALIMFDGSFHNILYPVHRMPLWRNLCRHAGI